MTASHNIFKRFPSPAMMLCIMLLASCSSAPVKMPIDTGSNISLNSFSPEALDSLLEQARRAPSPQAESRYLDIAQQLYDLNMIPETSDVLRLINTDNLPPQLFTAVQVLTAKTLIRSNQAQQALTLLNSTSSSALQSLTSAQQADIVQTRAAAHEAQGQHLQSADALIALDRQLNDAAALSNNHDLIWQSLTSLPATQLQQLAETRNDTDQQGWFELALISQRYQFNLDLLQQELQAWTNQWQRHPAALQMPSSLQLVINLQDIRPSRIALLLPLQSTAGQVVRDGFMSAYFNSRELGLQVPDVRFYDTSGNTNIQALHLQARTEGAELIIGPLLKQNVSALEAVPDLEVPTLALNTTDGTPLSPQLYQFSLSPENEARQIAERAWADGHRRAALLSPLEAPGDNYYTRKRDSFVQRWQELGGTIATQRHYDSNYTSAITTLLDIDTSEERHDRLSQVLNEPLSFTPRRRQDVDFIFLLSAPGPARQIKPTLGYLYAGDLPVYASQDIYSGQDRPQTDADLNGIYFADSPWLLSEGDELKQQVQTLFPQPSASLLRLQAFGIDAFRLYPHLAQLAQLEGYAHLPGTTGELYMSETGDIAQLFRWAQIRNGIAVPL